jgi:putative aldouronate transport system permease protein
MNSIRRKKKWKSGDIEIFVMALLGLIFLLVFAYAPMYGIILAFKSGDGYLNIMKAITDSRWVGMYNFSEFILDKDFQNVMLNTLGLNYFN